MKDMNKSTNGGAAADFQDVMVIWELRGDYPTDIPLFSDVDIAELTAGDNDPMFLTLPIGQENVKSKNGRYYDSAFLAELERQVIATKPIGIMGHLKAEDLGTDFPEEAIHWVGTKRVGEMLWGKGYVPPGAARERVRRYKATNKPLATSIFAEAAGQFDKAVNAVRMAAKSLKLSQIDIGPADRVGVPSLARLPLVTAEMQTNQDEEQMDKLQVINEMTAADARLLPKPVTEAILATVQPAPEVQLVSELRGALGVDDSADVVKLVSELKEAKEAAAKTAVTNRIKELVEDKETGVKVESMRGVITELITLRKPQTVEEANEAYKLVTEMESVKASLAAAVQGAMGPNLTPAAQPQNGKAKYFAIPQEDK